jgi:hypothetical protein
MRKARYDRISRLVHGLALGFRTGMVCASLSCHGSPLLWKTQIRICKRGTSRPFRHIPSSPAPIPRSFSPFHFLTLPHPAFPSLPLLRGMGYYYGKIADARRRDLARSGDLNLLSDQHDYYRERLPIRGGFSSPAALGKNTKCRPHDPPQTDAIWRIGGEEVVMGRSRCRRGRQYGDE